MNTDFLRSHPRLRQTLRRGAQRLLYELEEPAGQGAPAPAAAQDVVISPDAARFAREFDRGWLAAEGCATTTLLYERLAESDVAALETLIAEDPGLSSHYAATTNPFARQQLVIAYGIWLGNDAAAMKTGLSSAEPPEDVHVMARGPLAAAGGLYEADLIVSALASCGVEISSLRSGLDFGCSSGRVVRVLAAAYPALAWHGCDPNAPAIAWAAQNVPGIDFFVSGNAPPLQLQDESLDLAYAISIWSHFAPELGLRWFEEMWRVLRPGGYLLCTTHGLTSMSHYATLGLRTPEQTQEISDAIYRWGCWYTPEFGEEGDWGVINPDWGSAFLSPEWMLAQLCPRWRVLEFAPGRNQDNQDVYVLQRV
jgi:SAM-dependent methyltransferase